MTTEENQPKPSITLQDIASVVEIMRVCTERGVWRVTELSTVGAVYDRLVAFLDGAGFKFSNEPEPQSAPTDTETRT